MSVDVLAIVSHPDDAELCCSGLLLRQVDAGRSVGIIDLTRGEAGTRGTPETRAREAAAAGAMLGVSVRENLGLPDARIEVTPEAKRLVIEAIRRHRPKMVLTNWYQDLHPDHAATGQIVRAVRYLTPMPNYPADGEPHRVSVFAHFGQHTPFEPSFIVDVTDVWERKLEVIRCFASQLHDADVEEVGPGTRIGRPDFLLQFEGRHRHWGSRIGVPLGEPYWVEGPLPVNDLGGLEIDRMRIGITCYPTVGGSGAVATELGMALGRRGHEVHFICYAPPFRLDRCSANVHYHEVEVSSYPLFRYPPYDLALTSKMMEVNCERKLDVLHVHYAIPHSISAVLARQMMPECPAKVVTTLHGTDITIVGREKAYLGVTRFGLQQSDAVTAVSAFLRDETERVIAADTPIHVTPNFVDVEEFAPRRDDVVRRTLSPRPESKVLMHVSNFRPVKRVRDVVHVFAAVRREIDARLVLVGDGPDQPDALALAEDLGVREDVVPLGGDQDIASLLAAGDLFLLPSDGESFGLAALEAQACGVPVVGTLAGGLPEVVENGVTGCLCEVGDREAMAAHALDLLRCDDRHAAFGRAARERVKRLFDAEDVVAQYEAIYREVVGAAS